MNKSSWILILLGGYFIGSVNPSYILGKLLKSIDIREHGTRNAGATNTLNILGLGPALATAVFDLSKGLIVMYVAHCLGSPAWLVHLAGCAAISGHVFPVFIHFRGGQGVATATAILIFYLTTSFIRNWMPWESLLLLAFCTFSFAYITKKGELVGFVILPILAIFVIFYHPSPTYQIFILSLIVYILFINIQNIRRFRLVNFSSAGLKKEFNWRFFIRPIAVLLIVLYLQAGKREVLILIGTLFSIIFFLDLLRMLIRNVDIFVYRNIKDFYKPDEYGKFSSITYFLLSCLLVVMIFERSIAIMAISFLVFGDFFSKFFGLIFGRIKVFNKSLEGSLAHLNACLLSGYLFLHYVSIPASIYIAGALIATLSEILPLCIDDNISVPLLSASAMSILQLVFSIP